MPKQLPSKAVPLKSPKFPRRGKAAGIRGQVACADGRAADDFSAGARAHGKRVAQAEHRLA
jgi:hypothetical protein